MRVLLGAASVERGFQRCRRLIAFMPEISVRVLRNLSRWWLATTCAKAGVAA